MTGNTLAPMHSTCMSCCALALHALSLNDRLPCCFPATEGDLLRRQEAAHKVAHGQVAGKGVARAGNNEVAAGLLLSSSHTQLSSSSKPHCFLHQIMRIS